MKLKPLSRAVSCLGLAVAMATVTGCGGDDAVPDNANNGGDGNGNGSSTKTLTAESCSSLTSGKFTNSPASMVTKWVAAGVEKAASSATTTLPAHCVVDGTINPRTGVNGIPYGIQFELKLPAAWNGRFFFQGGGGTDGSVSAANGTINSADGGNNVALTQGFAVVSTDGGHENSTMPTTASFGQDPQARIDWGYNAIDKTTTTAKSIIQDVYGAAPDHSYFLGCSNGGRQGMVFMERFPDYFDGVVAGAPVMDLGSITAAEVWGLQAMAQLVTPVPGGTIPWSDSFSTTDQKLFTDAYVKQCDALDGATDGMVQNPASCHFDPAVLQCTGAKDATCWSPAQVAAVKKIVGGPENSSGGRVMVPGYQSLGENAVEGYRLDAGWMTPGGQPSRLIGTPTSAPGDLALGAAQIPYLHLATPDPSFDPLKMNWDTYPGLMTVNPPWLSNNTDLSAFKARGGKVIFYHGSADPGPSYANTVNYYNRLTQINGGATATQQFSRLFLVPSMNHCSGGPSTDSFDQLTAIVNWVEKGVAPDVMIAKARTGNTALASVTPAIPANRTRPLCPYPKTAFYNGSGSIDDAANFSCK